MSSSGHRIIREIMASRMPNTPNMASNPAAACNGQGGRKKRKKMATTTRSRPAPATTDLAPVVMRKTRGKASGSNIGSPGLTGAT